MAGLNGTETTQPTVYLILYASFQMEDDENGWRLFLGNNTEFILPLDYIRDMAVEEPGDSPVLMAKFGNKGRSFGQCTFEHSCKSEGPVALACFDHPVQWPARSADCRVKEDYNNWKHHSCNLTFCIHICPMLHAPRG